LWVPLYHSSLGKQSYFCLSGIFKNFCVLRRTFAAENGRNAPLLPMDINFALIGSTKKEQLIYEINTLCGPPVRIPYRGLLVIPVDIECGKYARRR
jgi:hypothetical protein